MNSDRLDLICSALGLPYTDDNRRYAQVVLAAAEVYNNREVRYHGAWKHFGWRGMLHDLRKKITRLWVEFWNEDGARGDVDDAIDIINYANFFVQAVEDGNEKGTTYV